MTTYETAPRKPIQWACAILTIPGWPKFGAARVLRSAIGEEMNKLLGSLAHSDWMGKDETGEVVQRPARIYYRFTEYTPQVFLWGELSHCHARELASRLQAIRLDTHEGHKVYPVTEIDISQGESELGVSASHRYFYELVSPIFPTDRQWARRPRTKSVWQEAWASEVITGCIRGLLMNENLRNDNILVHAPQMREVTVEWSRPKRDLNTSRLGIQGRFVSNVELPTGIALGRHGAEGYGEIKLLDTFDVPQE